MYRRVTAAAPEAAPEPSSPVALAVFEKQDALPQAYAQLDSDLGGILSDAIKRPEFAGSRGQVQVLYPVGDHAPDRVILVGLGKPEKFDAQALRIAAAKIVRTAWEARLPALDVRVSGALDGKLDEKQAGRALGDGCAIAAFGFDAFKSKPNGNGDKPDIEQLDLVVEAPLRESFDRALTVGRGANLARRLQATPPNIAGPSNIAAECRQVGEETGLNVRVIENEEARQLGLNGLVAVGAAGHQPPNLVCMEHKPSGAKNDGQPIMLVGKAITFDTGGYSIKPSAGMAGMKYDKSGGMAVIGAMQAVAQLKLPLHVVGLVPTAENMISEKGYRPDDILTMYNGTTVEVTNTDAEGRLVLADALAWGCKQYKPAAIFDLATLTGGVVVALGSQCAGYFSTDDELARKLEHAADRSGERLWRLPLWEEHKDLLKSSHADITNSGQREAHPIQGAAFLWHFVAKDGNFDAAPDQRQLPWAHIDIAAMAAAKSDTPLHPAGPTAFGVRLLLQTLEDWT